MDAEHQLLVATDVTANASDRGGLPVLLDQVRERFETQPATVLADAGYCNERDLADLETRGVDGYVAAGREDKGVAGRDLEKHPATGRMVEKLSTPAGRAVYAERKWLSEVPYGWVKHVLGFRRFSLRGLAQSSHRPECDMAIAPRVGGKGMNWLEDLARDLRRAVRGLGRNAGFTATVALILALGIGANTAMFSIVYSILLRPLPYADAGGIVSIGESSGVMGSLSGMFLSNRSMDLLQENANSFEQLAAYQEIRGERDGVTLRGARVSPALFPLLRARPHLGRLFLKEEARSGAPRVALLSHRAWTNHFAANLDIVGTSVDLGSNVHLVIGVLAEGLHFPTPDTEFWLPYVVEPTGASAAGGNTMAPFVAFRAIGRLQPGVSVEQATAEASSILREGGGLSPLLAAAGVGGGPQPTIRRRRRTPPRLPTSKPWASRATCLSGVTRPAACSSGRLARPYLATPARCRVRLCRSWGSATWMPCDSGCAPAARSGLRTAAMVNASWSPTRHWPASSSATSRQSAGR